MKKMSVFSNISWRFAERISTQLISTVVSIILARILLPEQYGIVAIVLVFIQFANVFISDGLGTSLIQKENVGDIEFSTIFYINLGISFILYTILFLIAPTISVYYGDIIITPVLRVLGIQLIFTSVKSIQEAYVARNMAFKKLFISNIGATFVSGSIGVILALKSFGVWALVAQYLISSFIGIVILAIVTEWRPKWMFSWQAVRGMIKYAWKLLGATMIGTLNIQIRNLIIGKRYSSSDLAYYSRGNIYPQVVMSSVNTSINTVLFPVYAKYQNDENSIKNTLRKSVRLSTYIIFPMMFGLCAIARPFTLLLLTEKWSKSIIFLQLAAISYATWAYQIPTQSVIKAIGRSDLYLVLEGIRSIVIIITTLIAASISVAAIAISVIAMDFISMIMISILQRRLLKYSYKEQVLDILQPAIYSIIMFVLIYFAIFPIRSNALQLLIGVAVGVVAYTTESLVFRNKEFNELMTIFNRT